MQPNRKMANKAVLLGLPLLMLALVISACGSSGGGGTADTGITYTGETTAASVTDTNAETLSSGAFDGGIAGNEMMVMSVTDQSGSGGNSSRNLLIAKTVQKVKSLLENNQEITTNITARAVQTVTDSYPGLESGTATITITVSDSGSFSGTFTFTNYSDIVGQTISGTISFSGSVDINSGEFASISMTFTAVTMTSGADSFTTSGTVTTTSYTSTGLILNMSMVFKDNTTQVTYWAKNYQLVVNYNVSLGCDEITISGEFYHPTEGQVTVTTTATLIVYWGDEWPSQGELKIVGANGSSAILSATTGTDYQIDIDSDGDGTYETTQTGAWNTIPGL